MSVELLDQSLLFPIKCVIAAAEYSNPQGIIHALAQREIQRTSDVPTPVIEKIEQFLKENGCNFKIQWRQGDRSRSIDTGPEEGLITLSSRIINEISDHKALSDTHKFVIAHELGHIAASDTTKSIEKRKQYWQENLEIVCDVSRLTFCMLSMAHPFLDVRVRDISAYAAGGIAGFAFHLKRPRKLERDQEFAADRFAAHFFKGGAQAGIAYFESERKKNVLIKNALIKTKRVHEHISACGDSLPRTHPLLTSREEHLRKIIQSFSPDSCD